MAEETRRPPGAVLGAVAALLAVLGLACLALVVIVGLFGSAVSPVFTWTGMVLMPLAFALMLVVLVQGIMRRRTV